MLHGTIAYHSMTHMMRRTFSPACYVRKCFSPSHLCEKEFLTFSPTVCEKEFLAFTPTWERLSPLLTRREEVSHIKTTWLVQATRAHLHGIVLSMEWLHWSLHDSYHWETGPAFLMLHGEGVPGIIPDAPGGFANANYSEYHSTWYSAVSVTCESCWWWLKPCRFLGDYCPTVWAYISNNTVYCLPMVCHWVHALGLIDF